MKKIDNVFITINDEPLANSLFSVCIDKDYLVIYANTGDSKLYQFDVNKIFQFCNYLTQSENKKIKLNFAIQNKSEDDSEWFVKYVCFNSHMEMLNKDEFERYFALNQMNDFKAKRINVVSIKFKVISGNYITKCEGVFNNPTLSDEAWEEIFEKCKNFFDKVDELNNNIPENEKNKIGIGSAFLEVGEKSKDFPNFIKGLRDIETWLYEEKPCVSFFKDNYAHDYLFLLEELKNIFSFLKKYGYHNPSNFSFIKLDKNDPKIRLLRHLLIDLSEISDEAYLAPEICLIENWMGKNSVFYLSDAKMDSSYYTLSFYIDNIFRKIKRLNSKKYSKILYILDKVYYSFYGRRLISYTTFLRNGIGKLSMYVDQLPVRMNELCTKSNFWYGIFAVLLVLITAYSLRDCFAYIISNSAQFKNLQEGTKGAYYIGWLIFLPIQYNSNLLYNIFQGVMGYTLYIISLLLRKINSILENF